MRYLPLFALCLAAAPATADVNRTIDDHILPGHAALVAKTEALAQAAETSCAVEDLRPHYHASFDAWLGVSHIQFGPIEDQGLALSMAFWPDPKDRVGKAIRRLRTDQDPVVQTPEGFAEESAAVLGFTALERLLFDAATPEGYDCDLMAAITSALARNSAALNAGWQDHASLLRSAGADGNDRYQSPKEAQRALYTSLSTGLEFLHDVRLGRPLGTFDRPRPNRAEARRSERALRNISLSLAALQDLATSLSDMPIPKTDAAFAKARQTAEGLQDPALAGVADPGQRIRIEALQLQVAGVQRAIANEIGAPMGVSAGFNSLDGD